MACDTSYRLEAVNARWGKENKVKVTPVTGLSGGEYFEISSTDTDYYVWFTVNASGADPEVAGRTGIQVDLDASYTVAQANDEIIDALDTTGNFFYVEEDSAQTYVCISNLDIGAANAAAGAGDSGFTVATEVAGFSLDLGETAEGVEIATEATLFDVVPNQTGTVIADQIIQGFTASCSLGLVQLTDEKWQKLIGEGFGSNYTAGANTVTGLGTGKNFNSSFDYAGRLILNPVRLGSADRSEDINFWKCVPVAESVNYSGTDLLTMSLSFNALRDTTKDTGINLMVRGDSSAYMG